MCVTWGMEDTSFFVIYTHAFILRENMMKCIGGNSTNGNGTKGHMAIVFRWTIEAYGAQRSYLTDRCHQ